MPHSDPEATFLNGLLELQYGVADIVHLQTLAQAIPWAKGWPLDNKAFWNAEAFMWSHKIDRAVRQLITNQLSFLNGKRNLDLGCGAYSYLPSVGFDLSEKMLRDNDQCYEKVQGSVEQPLPFPRLSFDSATAIFVLNYVQNHHLLLSEIFRVLRPNGHFVMILSAIPINAWQRQKEVHSFSPEHWQSLLERAGFMVSLVETSNLLIFSCGKDGN